MLQQEMAVLHRTFQAAYPGRKGFAMSGTQRASKMAGGAGSALLHLGQTPRTRELFLSGAGTGDRTDRAVHGSTLSDFFRRHLDGCHHGELPAAVRSLGDADGPRAGAHAS